MTPLDNAFSEQPQLVRSRQRRGCASIGTTSGGEVMRGICVVTLACVATSVAAMAGQKPAAASTYKGFISDKKCGKNIDPACNKKCFEEGETPVLVVDGSGE